MRMLLKLTNRVKSLINQSLTGPIRLLILSAAFIGSMALLMASGLIPQWSSAHGLNSSKSKQQGCCSNLPPTIRRMIGTYYTTEDNFKSTLILNNKGPHQIAITPILHAKNGQSFTAPSIVIAGQSSSEVDLNAMAAIAGSQFRSGSIGFTYTGRMMEMGGGLTIVNTQKSLIFDEQMLEPGMKFSSSRLEAVYAIPFDSAEVSVIVTNTTAEALAIKGDSIFEGANGHHPINEKLGPYSTEVVKLPHGLVKKASAGAVSLSHNGKKGALLAVIHLRESDKGYSETVNFTDPGHGKTKQLHGAGLKLGSVKGDALSPMIAIHNIGDDAKTVTASVPYTRQNGEEGKISLPRISLAPGEIRLLDTTNSQLKRNDLDTAGLEIEYSGAPGSLIASATSVSQSGNHVFGLPLKDPQGGMSSTGGYPWFINGSASTIVFVKNVTGEPQDFMIDVVYPGGRWGSQTRTLAPNQTFMLDVRKLRDSQEKSSGGIVIPPNASSGHISWSVRGNKNKTLIGRAQTVDFSNGMASTYECQCVCGWSWGRSQLSPAIITGFPGDTQLFLLQSKYNDCYGNESEWQTITGSILYSSYVSYYSDNPGVATIQAPGQGAAIAPGATDLHAEWTETIWQSEFTVDGVICNALSGAALCAAFCDVQNINLTIANNKPNGIKPTGIIAGVRGADPVIPAEDTRTTITVTTDPARSGRSVNLSLVGIEGGYEGGHFNHTGVRPLGTLSHTSGVTDSNGMVTVTYTAPIFSGVVRIRATMDGISREDLITVFIDGLPLLGAGSYYVLTGATPGTPAGNRHPINHYGIANAVTGLPGIASDYYNAYFNDPAGARDLRYNDMSLVFGGKFEIDGDWGNDSHLEHRVGRNCDVSVDEGDGGNRRRIPASRWVRLNEIFLDNLVQEVGDETNTIAFKKMNI